MSRFEIHPQLLHDCHRLGQLRLCHVLLHKNAAVPWLILVPETASSGDLLDLPGHVRNAAMDEAAIVARFIKNEFAVSKINFAAIGNIVPQLHLHVVGRTPTILVGLRQFGAILQKGMVIPRRALQVLPQR
jgi:diadenosine tetraphosphate (Ap4A) HIT family hydrolase